ncbi:inverted formin-2-like [Haliotis asinina]|uniref:inverted formin-2-like n=1 Tax=Haliotis asinina TaxID=109174 RepID=UPI0035322F52
MEKSLYIHNENQGFYIKDKKQSLYALDKKQSLYPLDNEQSLYSLDNEQSLYPLDNEHSLYPEDNKQNMKQSIYSLHNEQGLYPLDNIHSLYSLDKKQRLYSLVQNRASTTCIRNRASTFGMSNAQNAVKVQDGAVYASPVEYLSADLCVNAGFEDLSFKMLRTQPSTVEQDRTITSEQLEQQLEGSDPHQCVVISHTPSVQVYYALRTKLESSDETWLQEFISLSGLDSLLDSLCQMTGKAFTGFSDAILQIDCISCIRAILNTRVGLDHFLSTSTCIKKLTQALTITNTLPKKQVLEILSAIMAYSTHGYKLVITALEHFKREENQSHRFSIVLNELKSAETVPHKTAVMTFLNCIINCNTNIAERTRCRNELAGLGLLDVLSFLQREEVDVDLHIQLQTFHSRKHQDEEEMAAKCDLDLSSPHDLVDKIQEKVFGSSKMASFVNILQDLLAMEANSQSEKMWTTIENQIHHLIHGSEDEDRLAKVSPEEIEALITPDINMANNFQRKLTEKLNTPPKKLNDSVYENWNQTPTHKLLNDLNTPTRNKLSWNNNFNSLLKQKENFEGKSVCGDSFTRQLVPLPKKPMRNLKWIIVETEAVESHPSCIWQKIENIPRIQPDYNHIEEIFSETHVFEEYEEVPLLSQTSRLNINLFINRLEVEPEELVRNLIDGEPSSLTLPMLRYLTKILPEHEEVQMLKAYNGNLLELGLAEQFLLHLSDIPNYRTLINGHLTRAEFTSNIVKLKTTLTAMVASCKFILSSSDLREFLQLVLRIGNFLNHSKFNGNAAGYKLTSLERVMDVKSSVLNKTLMHYLVEVAVENDDSTLSFLSEIPRLEKAASYSPEDIKMDVTKMNQQLKQFVQQLSSAHPTIQDVFHFFMEDVKRDFREMQASICELRSLSHQMADYFCEAETDFDLQGCFKCLHAFWKQIRKCRQENSMFGNQEKMIQRRSDEFKTKIKHKRLALEFGQEAKASSSMREDKRRILEKILSDLHHANFTPTVASLIATPQTEVTKRKQFLPAQKELKTPENEFHPLDLSRISVAGTPMVNRPRSEAFDDDFPNFSSKVPPKVMTSSENNLLDEDPVWMKRPTKISLPRRNSHYRSRSDLGESLCGTTKWVRYEEIKLKQNHNEIGQAPLAKPESCCTLATLHLEDNGKFTYQEEMSLHDGPMVVLPKLEGKPSKKLEKRSSIGNFFSKISRRVLRPKNVNMCYNTNNSSVFVDDGGMKPIQNGRRFSSDNKENISTGLSKNEMAMEKRYAEREYRRFKAQRQKGSREKCT